MIDSWHKQRGWDKIGYHYFIRKNGLIEGGRYVEKIGAHCKGKNRTSIGICLAGLDRFSDAEFESLFSLLSSLRRIWPKATVHGHNEFSTKLCPVYNVSRYAKFYQNNERKKSWNFLAICQKLWKLFSRS